MRRAVKSAVLEVPARTAPATPGSVFPVNAGPIGASLEAIIPTAGKHEPERQALGKAHLLIEHPSTSGALNSNSGTRKATSL
jgi:hypothetical protein